MLGKNCGHEIELHLSYPKKIRIFEVFFIDGVWLLMMCQADSDHNLYTVQ
jgi:hypothetical protein